MNRLRLRDLRDGHEYVFSGGPVLIGRSPECDFVVGGSGRELVSARHAKADVVDGEWTVADAGGRNGTYVDGRRVREGTPHPLCSGQTLGLGELGPKFTVEIERVAATGPAANGSEDATVPLSTYVPSEADPPPEAVLVVSLVRVPSGHRLDATGAVLRVGRGEECEIRLAGEKVVSRVHCEFMLGPDEAPVVRDAHSRNGTLLDGHPVAGERVLHAGARIRLGPEGPELIVEQVRVTGAHRPAGTSRLAAPVEARAPASPPKVSVPPPTSAPPKRPPPMAPTAPEPAAARDPVRRSFGGVGRTVFVRQLIQDTDRKHASRVRTVVWAFVALLVAGVGGVYWLSQRRVRETREELAAQRVELTAARAAADSSRAAALADYQRLQLDLERAREGSAPAAVVDSLRLAFNDARSRTASLEAALDRARSEMEQQLDAGDSLRRAQAAESQRLRAQLTSSQAGGVSTAELASLRAEVRAAEERAAALEAGLRAVRGADLARIAEANQAAVGLVSVYAGADIYDGSGFVISTSGYFVTNRHVATPEGRTPDSIHVTMADQRTGYRATLVAVQPAGGPDLAVLRIPRYVGPIIARVDWDGTRARQGEPAALIGFPAGVAAALDNTRTVRTSMSAGIFSKVTPTQIQFDGFTVGGSSGSPIFNADGEVVAVHAAGLREAAGLGFAVPVRLVLPLLPDDAQREVRR
jgi:pSer/pThr/pTyr-binding forkhead associated (FHA) protein/S1-C subfamily serine protease